MDEWLEDLDKCKDMGWYFEIESEESGRLADDIRKVLARIEQLEAALHGVLNFIENTESELGITLSCGNIARVALGKKKNDK